MEQQRRNPSNVPQTEEDYTELLAQFNSSPRALLGLLTNIEAMKGALDALEKYHQSLKEALDEANRKEALLERRYQILQAHHLTMHQTSVPRVKKLEQCAQSLLRGKQGPTAATVENHQQLWGLMRQACQIYTPKVMQHFLKKELDQCTTTSARLAFLAEKHHLILEIKRVYLPDSALWVNPNPMDPRLAAELRSLTQEEQETRINWYWTEIRNSFKDDSREKIILFELEDQTLQMKTHQERMAYLQNYINSGQEAADSLPKQGTITLIKKMMGLRKP